MFKDIAKFIVGFWIMVGWLVLSAIMKVSHSIYRGLSFIFKTR